MKAADKVQANWLSELWDLGRVLGNHDRWAPMTILRTWSLRQVHAAQAWAAETSLARLHKSTPPQMPSHVAALKSADAVLQQLEVRRRLSDLATTANRNGGFK